MLSMRKATERYFSSESFVALLVQHEIFGCGVVDGVHFFVVCRCTRWTGKNTASMDLFSVFHCGGINLFFFSIA